MNECDIATTSLLLRPNRPVSDSRLRVAVPVAAAGAKQAELDRNISEARTQVGIVTGVTSLHRVQPLALEPLDEGSSSPFLQMRDGDQAARAAAM